MGTFRQDRQGQVKFSSRAEALEWWHRRGRLVLLLELPAREQPVEEPDTEGALTIVLAGCIRTSVHNRVSVKDVSEKILKVVYPGVLHPMVGTALPEGET
jgi:hypothetical protein